MGGRGHSGLQRQVLHLYREFLKVAQMKNNPEIRNTIRHQFRAEVRTTELYRYNT